MCVSHDHVQILENTREDKFQQTFWTPIRVKTLKFVALQRAIRPCMAFKFFGCKINEGNSIIILKLCDS